MSRRKRLWELDSRWHCPIIGTCLTVRDLKKVLARGDLRLAPPITDHARHGACVSLSRQKGAAAKLMERIMDQRYRATVSRLSRITSAENLAAEWRAHVDRGEIAGAFWALMTHPLTPETLAENIFGEVHMLSHLSGAEVRADMTRLAQAEARADDLERRLAETTQALRGQLRQREQRIAELEHAVRSSAALRRRLETVEDQLAAHESGALLAEARDRLAEAERGRATAESRLETLSAKLAAREQRLEAAETARRRAERRRANGEPLAETGGARAEPDIRVDLGGRRILYVGGSVGSLPHFRAVAEKYNADLVHHDGGREDGIACLDGAIAQADVVLCPMDCVSHEAVRHVKKACAGCSKRFMPLHTSSLSAFANSLRDLQPPASRSTGQEGTA